MNAEMENINNTNTTRYKRRCYDCFLFTRNVLLVCFLWILVGVYFTVYFVYMFGGYAISNDDDNTNEMFIWWSLLMSSIYICFQLCLFSFLCMENIDDLFLGALCSKNRLYRNKCVHDFDLNHTKLSCFLLSMNILFCVLIIVNLNLFIHTNKTFYETPLILLNITNSILHFFFIGLFFLFTTQQYYDIPDIQDIEDIPDIQDRYIYHEPIPNRITNINQLKSVEYEYI